MRLGSLLTGIGGYDLGFERAEWNIAWQIERDPFRRRVLARHWPKVPRYEDLVLNVFPSALPSVDCLTLDCPTHDYRDSHGLWEAAREVFRVVRPPLIVICTPIAAKFRDDGEDWKPLVESVEALDYHASDTQICISKPGWQYERQFLIAHRDPLPTHLRRYIGIRAGIYLGKKPDMTVTTVNLDYGAIRKGDVLRGEQDWGFPEGWTDVEGTRAERCRAIIESTSVDVAHWLGSMLLGKGEENG